MTTAGIKRAGSAEGLQRLVLLLTAFLLTLLIAAALVALGWWLLRNRGYANAYPLTVRFADTQGVDAGAPVTMAGVTIGQARQVRLNGSQADVDIQIKEGVSIPKGSRFLAMPALFGLPGSIVIAAPESAAETGQAIAPHEPGLTGQAAGSLPDTLARANHLMDQLTDVSEKSSALLNTANRAVKEANGAIKDGRTQGDLRATLANVRMMSASGADAAHQMARLLGQTQLTSRELIGNLNGMTNEMRGMTAEIRGVTKTSAPVLTATLADMKQTTARASHLTAQADDLMTTGNYGPRFSEIVTTLGDTTKNMKTLSDKMNTLADSAQKIAGDPQLAANVADTIRNLKTASDTLKSTLEKMDKILAQTPPLVPDPAVVEDAKATLHSLREVSELSTALLQQMTKAAGKGGKK